MTAAATLVLDQLTKAWVRGEMELHTAIPVLGDFVRLRFVKNAGAAFGLFQGSRLLFIAISLASVAMVMYLILSGRYRFRGSHVAFGLVMGGAIGNMVDRFVIPEVIDFIDIGIGLHRWPTFNVADIGVTLGVLYLAASFLAGEWEGRRQAEPGGEEPAVPTAAGPAETRSDG